MSVETGWLTSASKTAGEYTIPTNTFSPAPRERIDYILASEALCAHQYERSDYLKLDNGGDHLGVNHRLTRWHHPRGPGTWRVPRRLLEMDGIRDEITLAAKELLSSLGESDNPGVLWTAWKYRVRKYLQREAVAQRSVTRRMLETLNRRLELLITIHATDQSPEVTIALYNAKRDFETFCEAQDTSRRSQHFDYLASEMETTSASFFRQPDVARRVPLDSVELADGSVSTDLATIYDTFQQQWGDIFGDPRFVTDPHDVGVDQEAQDRLVHAVEDKLTPDQGQELDAPLTTEEFVKAITTMRSDGAPGPDGLTARFYQIAPEVFGAILAQVFDAQFRRGKLLSHQNLSEIFLLHKKGSRASVGNYRPISLMPVEVKVLSRVLVARLKPLMHHLIH